MGKVRSIEVAKKGGRSGLIGGDGRDSLRDGGFDVESLRNGSFDVDGIEGRGIVRSLVEHIESKAFATDVSIDQVHVSSHRSSAPGALARDIHRGNAYDNDIDATTTLTTDPSNPKPLIEPCFVCLDDIPIPDFDKHIDRQRPRPLNPTTNDDLNHDHDNDHDPSSTNTSGLIILDSPPCLASLVVDERSDYTGLKSSTTGGGAAAPCPAGHVGRGESYGARAIAPCDSRPFADNQASKGGDHHWESDSEKDVLPKFPVYMDSLPLSLIHI